jgi:predicted outer membrane repeat protein
MLRFVRSWSAISRSLPQFAPARRPHARQRPMLECLEDRALLSTIPITVSSLADSGGGTLRSAIAAADMGSTNNYVINIKTPGTITLESALPDLGNNITILGLGACTSTVQRDTSLSTPFRIFTVDAGETVKISGLTIAGGTLSPFPRENGAGIDNSGTLTVSNCVFSGNSDFRDDGGGIFNESGGTLTVSGSSFTGNGARFSGGGIANLGTATVSWSTFTGNGGSTLGGGIFNGSGGTLTVSGSSFTGNGAFDGGGIFNGSGGTLTVIGSSFTGNSAGFGGGIANLGTATVSWSTFTGNSNSNSRSSVSGDTYGGGIANSGTATVSDSAFTNNSATDSGGGIYNNGPLTVIGSSFTGNGAFDGGGIFNDSGGTATVKKSTFTDNSATDGGGIYTLGTLINTKNVFFHNTGGDIGP